MQYRRRVLPLNHKGVLCRKTLTTGRLLTEIAPYATWSSTLPWIVLVLTFHFLHFLFSFFSIVLVPCFGPVHFGIPGSLHQQFEMEYHQTSDCSLSFPASQPIEFLWFFGFWVFPFWPGLKNNDGRKTWFFNCKLVENKNKDSCRKCLPLLENPPVCLNIVKRVVVAISYALTSSSALF